MRSSQELNICFDFKTKIVNLEISKLTYPHSPNYFVKQRFDCDNELKHCFEQRMKTKYMIKWDDIHFGLLLFLVKTRKNNINPFAIREGEVQNRDKLKT